METIDILRQSLVLAKYSKRSPNVPIGTWTYELDVVIWLHRNKLCAVLRNAEVGTLNGYAEAPMDTSNKHLYVHGGITFHEHLHGTAEHTAILDGRPFLGFDCAHAGDLVPVITGISELDASTYPLGVYRDLDYVVMETKKMATQLYGP